MIFLTDIRVTNTRAVIAELQQAGKDVRDGVSEGIQKSVKELEAAVRSATPVKTGKAKAAVFGRMRSALEGRVGYGKEVAWYMKIVELSGAVPHEIYAKGDNPNNPRSQKAARSRGSQSKRRLYNALVAAGVDPYRVAELTGSTRGTPKGTKTLRFLKLALAFGGGHPIKGGVYHPGIEPKWVLRKQLAATQQNLVANIRAEVAEKLSSPRGASWNNDTGTWTPIR